MIKCEYSKEDSPCEVCKEYYKCNLHKPCSLQLYQIKQELNWYIQRTKIIDQSINHYINVLYNYEHQQYLPSIQKRLNKNKLLKKLQELRTEKSEVMSKIETLRVREKNIEKILERRNQK